MQENSEQPTIIPEHQRATFPNPDSVKRLANYQHYDRLFTGDHYDAFNIKIDSQLYGDHYAKLRYVTVNYAGMLTRLVSDVLFGEEVQFKFENQKIAKFTDALVFENNLHTQFYESALSASRHGDDVFKIRAGKINPLDQKNGVIIEQINPDIYFPKVNPGSWRETPEYEDLAWLTTIDKMKVVRIERHFPGRIENQLWQYENKKLVRQLPVTLIPGLEESQETGINRSLLIHVPNWRTDSYFGVSDYRDLESLMYALNNRVTKNENVLDKHTDPILALPEGLTDKDGKLRKDKLELFIVPDNDMGSAPMKPEYITWNASLENSFKQVDKLVDFLFMTSEISPDSFGMGKHGAAESGRALKLRLMRTLAKVNRKKRYYDAAIKKIMVTAQELASVHGYVMLGQTMKGVEAEIPQITWSDGLPIDDAEQIENQHARVDAGTQTVQEAIQKLDGISEDKAKAKAQEIKEQNQIEVPTGDPVVTEPEA